MMVEGYRKLMGKYTVNVIDLKSLLIHSCDVK